jgi:imidazolonepropionase-like amidohydrolase
MRRLFLWRSLRAVVVALMLGATWMLLSPRVATSAAAQRGPVRPAGAGRLALVGGTLIDGTGTPPQRNAVVLIDGARIERVGTVETLPVPSGYTVVSTEGQTVLPGLWDLHVHLLYAGHTDLQYWHRTYTSRFERDIMPATAGQLLQAGVTSVRDMGAPPDAIFAVQKRIADGGLQGPTIYAAGPQLTHAPPDWAQYYRWPVTGAADATTKAARLLDAGAALLKVTDAEAMAADEIKAITGEAHRRGKRVAAHGRTDAEIRIGLDGGVDEFQHIGIAGNGVPFPADLIAAIRARIAAGLPVYWTPTVGLPMNSAFFRDDPELLDAPANYAGLPPLIAADVRKALLAYRPQPGPIEAISRKVKQLTDAGVQLLVGTDGGLAGNPHSQATWQEMDVWVRELGFSPLEMIRRATMGAATAMGADREVGSVTAGKYADVIVVSGDPLRHISVLRAPTIVVKHGVRVK